MGFVNSFVLKAKRGETPFYRSCAKVIRALTAPKAPRIPDFLRPVFGALYELHFGIVALWNGMLNVCYRSPLFQGRCSSFGHHVVVDRLPYVNGHVDISVGNHVWIGGNVNIFSGRVVDHPKLILKDHVEIAWNVTIVVSKEVIIEEHARVANNCRIADSDGHPRQADLRAVNAPVQQRDIRPVRIGKHAWIGNGSQIMKGVTIGEGAVVGAQSVVISDVPPYSLVLGNPAEVLMRNYGRPSKKQNGDAA